MAQVIKGLTVLGAEARPAYGMLPPVEGILDCSEGEGEEGGGGGGAESVRALYVHVPFCNTKCHYCDFYSVAGHMHEAEAYLVALGREMTLHVGHFGRPRPETVFIGGGTPTLLTPGQLGRLLGLVRGAMDGGRLVEFTVEANPNTFDREKARVLAEHEVNRISFGAQSFVPRELAVLQRDHDPASVAEAIGCAVGAGLTHYNLDLIFGTPGQTVEDWDYSLGRALELGPEHLSCYSLIYEPNTPMTARMERGDFAQLEERVELEIFQHTYDRLRAAGLKRYEVSNYARPGRECRHNLHYWKGSDYLGWGASAASGYRRYHWKNVGSLAHYLAALAPGAEVVPVTQLEHLSARRRAGETAMLTLRLAEGLEYEEFLRTTGVEARGVLAGVLRKYEGLGFLESDARGVRFTEAGVPVSDHILADVVEAFGD